MCPQFSCTSPISRARSCKSFCSGVKYSFLQNASGKPRSSAATSRRPCQSFASCPTPRQFHNLDVTNDPAHVHRYCERPPNRWEPYQCCPVAKSSDAAAVRGVLMPPCQRGSSETLRTGLETGHDPHKFIVAGALVQDATIYHRVSNNAKRRDIYIRTSLGK